MSEDGECDEYVFGRISTLICLDCAIFGIRVCLQSALR